MQGQPPSHTSSKKNKPDTEHVSQVIKTDIEELWHEEAEGNTAFHVLEHTALYSLDASLKNSQEDVDINGEEADQVVDLEAKEKLIEGSGLTGFEKQD